jgi:hypothetical protein
MSDGGKGSKPRPFSVAQEEYEQRWDAIFQRDNISLVSVGDTNDNTGVTKNEFQDILSTEDCMTMDMPGTIGGAKIVFKE